MTVLVVGDGRERMGGLVSFAPAVVNFYSPMEFTSSRGATHLIPTGAII